LCVLRICATCVQIENTIKCKDTHHFIQKKRFNVYHCGEENTNESGTLVTVNWYPPACSISLDSKVNEVQIM